MYSNLSVQVILPNGLSPSFMSKVGVKQGCNLSPTLFNIFINDLISAFDSTEQSHDPTIGNLNITCLLYADDLVLVSKTKQGLQNLLNTLEKYTTDWYMNINMKKTKCIIFGRKKDIKTQFYFGSTPVENCNNYTYLGIMLTVNGSLKNRIKNLEEKASKSMYG